MWHCRATDLSHRAGTFDQGALTSVDLSARMALSMLLRWNEKSRLSSLLVADCTTLSVFASITFYSRQVISFHTPSKSHPLYWPQRLSFLWVIL